MRSENDLHRATDLLTKLRRDVGDIEFGFRAQAYLAHVLFRLGAEIIAINAQGHPDICAALAGRELAIEVEVANKAGYGHVLKADDLNSICPHAERGTGYLAVLECGYPLRWTVIGYERLKYRKLGMLPLSTLRAVRDQQLSDACSEEFVGILLDCQDRISNLTFHLLVGRVLAGEKP